jgi:hypothetical protein
MRVLSGQIRTEVDCATLVQLLRSREATPVVRCGRGWSEPVSDRPKEHRHSIGIAVAACNLFDDWAVALLLAVNF